METDRAFASDWCEGLVKDEVNREMDTREMRSPGCF